MITRRELLRLLSLTPLGALGPAVVPQQLAWAQTADVAALPDVEFTLAAAAGEESVLPGMPTGVSRFSATLIRGPAGTLEAIPGSFLGPVIRLRRGQRVRVRFLNQLREESIVHWHGLDVPEGADGHPRLAVAPGKDYVYDFDVTNRAGTYWYHPHPHMRTGAQVYQGLAGLLLVGDVDEDALALPSRDAELLCVLQDRVFDSRNQLVYSGGAMMEMMNGMLGARVLVSGRPERVYEVDAGWHRVRLLNGSNARIYKLAWSHGVPMTVIGTDGGLLERPIVQRALTLAPGQRADLLLDLTGVKTGTEIQLDSVAFPELAAGRVGMMGGAPVPNGAPLRIMTLRARSRAGAALRLPARLTAFDRSWPLSANAKIRRVTLEFQRMQWFIAGRTFAMNEVAADEVVRAGETQVWEFVNQSNRMGMHAAHPIHLHGRQFRVVSRTGGAPNALREGIIDAGWMDTVLVLPGETVRVQVPFSTHRGTYLYHCHILEHEDMGMMRNYRIA